MSVNLRLSQVIDVSSRAAHAYTLCGWHTQSDIPLTCMPTVVGDGESADVIIQIAPGESPIVRSPDRSDWARFEHSTERSLIAIAGVADFEVRRGQKILIWPAAGAAQKDIELVLFGPVWAALCHQRGILPLHASAISAQGGIIAFAGRSGVGKSITAALMGSLGYELITDDILPVSFNQDSEVGAWPYLRRLKLQRDAITKLALTPMDPVSDALDKEKYFVRPKFAADDKWNRLQQLYLLEIDPSASSISIDRITGVDAVRVLIDQTYHFQFVLGSGRFREHLELCVQLASKIRVYRLRRPPSFDIGEELGSLICAQIQDVPA